MILNIQGTRGIIRTFQKYNDGRNAPLIWVHVREVKENKRT